MTIITRFAPSPTGRLHPGHAYSAVFARNAGDKFILRIEDIDPTRCKPEFEQGIYEDLAWLGLNWETPVRRQSDHLGDYRAALEKLNAMGFLYPCFCTRKDIADAGGAPHGPEGTLYPGTCRHLNETQRADKIASGAPYAWRLDMTRAKNIHPHLTWHDRDKGAQTATPEILGDVVLARKDIPTSYHLSVTVDDALQGVTLVTRGEDLFYATHVHRLLQALLGLPVPEWHHHGLLLGPDGKRYAKRDKSITLQHMRIDQKKTPADILKLIGMAACVMLCVLSPARAEDTPAQDNKSFISVAVENDKFTMGGKDQNYTSGVRISYFNVNAKVPRALNNIAENIPTFGVNDATGIVWSLGQNLYTPQSVGSQTADPDDRPWAAWLYASAGLVTVTGSHIDEVELTLGVIGPAAQGEETQTFVHDVLHATRPEGWNNQLHNEPGLMVSWRRRWPYAFKTDFAGLRLSAEPDINATLGNVYTYAGTGLSLRLGPSSAMQDMPPRVRPSIPGTGYFETPPPNVGWYLFAGAEGRAVARNIFLDGNTFRDSPSVDKNNFVADLTAGVAFTWGPARLAYSFTSRTKEFKTQDDHDEFGSINLTFRY